MRDSLVITTGTNIKPVFVTRRPESYVSNARYNVDPSENLNLAAEQLVEVEEIEEIDPAIFGAVSNYFFDEVSIRLPNDQLFDDVLEEYSAR